ncbi:MAG: polysaccharide biosynthesis tyrosine autokinase [Dysgonamonadaceae bacterium]|jgi:capsular exopolysaccharide synthesis family protein|nr:polysaccharide biosynthesis tyrosine autokinase [Dysgonamonadaceae bacterium]
MDNNEVINTQPDEEISITEILFRYLIEWKLFAFSVAICVFVACVYLLTSAPQYKVASKILISDEKKGSTEDVMSAFQDLGIFQEKNNLDNEIEILRSRNLMKKVADSLHLNVGYFKEKRFKTLEIYKNSPFTVSVKDCREAGEFTVNLTDSQTVAINAADFEETVQFGEEVMTPYGLVTITPNPYGTEEYPVIVRINPGALPFIDINAINKTSSVIEISIFTGNTAKGRDIINTVVDIYNNDAIESKNYVAFKTINTINERLHDNTGELAAAEHDVEKYRINEGVMDLQAQGQLLLSSTAQISSRLNECNTQLLILQSTKSFITNSVNEKSQVPSSEGLHDQTIIGLINAYNKEIYDKKNETSGMLPTMPLVKEYDKRISSLRDNLLKGIENSISTLEVTIRELRHQENIYRVQASSLPTKEKESRGLLRQQNAKETIVNYLLQKNEETRLALALATPNAKIIDDAVASPGPVKPVKSVVLLAALIIGLVLPVIVIYVRDLFDTKIHGKQEGQKIIKAPFLGDIPFSKNSDPIPAMLLRSSLAEKFRLIASNLNFIANTKDAKVLAVTSYTPNEGKSFVARNLAYSLASTGKKTLLLDCDLRKSVMKNILTDMKKQKGTTMYLADSSVSLDDIIDTKFYSNKLDVVSVKVYPPNPTELLYSDRMETLFKELKTKGYEYIIVDTAPVSLVSDSYVINRFADATIFVVRAEYTEKNALKEIQDIYRNNKLNNLTWVLNAASNTKRYGYYGSSDYGYYYHDESEGKKTARKKP